MHVYGHLVAADIFGDGYVVPLLDSLNDIKQCLDATEVVLAFFKPTGESGARIDLLLDSLDTTLRDLACVKSSVKLDNNKARTYSKGPPHNRIASEPFRINEFFSANKLNRHHEDIWTWTP